MTFQNLTLSSLFTRSFRLIFLAASIWAHSLAIAGSPIDATGYYCWDGFEPNLTCSRDDGNNTMCDYDSVVWDNLIIDVREDGVLPTFLMVGVQFPFDGTAQTRIIDVNADGSYRLRPDGGPGYWGSWAPNAGSPNNPAVWTIWSYDGPTSIDPDGQVTISTLSCEGPAVTRHATVRLIVGTPNSPPRPPIPTPTPGRNTKSDDEKEGGDQHGPCDGMARYSVHSMRASLNIVDTPLRYEPAFGPSVRFNVTYNQLETQQPAAFWYSNLGPKWTFDWLSYVTDDPNQAQPVVATVYVPGGGSEAFWYDPPTHSYPADPQSMAVLVKTGPASYERRIPDGSKYVYALSDASSAYPRRIFMTQLIDPTGNAVTIGYDASFRVTTFTDALNQVTNISYELAADPLKVTRVTDPFGRFATFEYTNGLLTKITDEIGIQSQFTYTSGTDSIDSLTTPYGTTAFLSGANGTNRWIEITDPMGGRERVEYRDNAPGISATDPARPTTPPNTPSFVNAGLDVANTFYWDKKAMAMAPGDYTKAEITHWLYETNGQVSGIASSRKKPLENRVWYMYPGQLTYQYVGTTAKPSRIARIFGDGTTQLQEFSYNKLGKVQQTVDPVGRVTNYFYDSWNQIDLLEIRQMRGTNNELLRKFDYNAAHQPLTDMDAAGQTTSYTYNAQGQLLTRTNAKNETTTYTYGGTVPAGCLASTTSPPFNGVSAVTTFAYDSFKRVRTVTDPDNYTVTTDYDNLDRKTKVTYPDGTFEQFQYTDNVTGLMTLDLTRSRDRRGLWTYRHYNANEQMDSITDPANRITRYGYCTCGALTSITDPKNQTTTFNRDIQSRVYQKVFQDGTTIDYLYEGQTAPNTTGATSRLQSSTDAKSQRKNYLYFADDNIQQISYTNLAGQPLTPPTPSVSYTYDPNYNRVSTMIDGTGTTTYGYNPIAAPPALGAGQLASIDAPLASDTITFGYDQLGRVTNRSVGGTANSETWTFDTLGRVSTDVNKLGTFTNTYVGVTNRMSKITYPGSMTVNYLYFPNAQDKRLQQIKNLSSKNAMISQFDYTYDVEGEIKTWTKNYAGLAAPQRFDLGYDNADQLTTAPLKNASTNALIKQYTYGYDTASNRTSETVASTTTTSTPNNVNEITSQSGGLNRTLGYDLNGSITSDGGTRTFEWDGANRLVAINYTGFTTRSEFSYDGLSRVAKIVEKTGATINSTRKIVWCGNTMCEFRAANDAVTDRIYSQGQNIGNTAYYYTRDHLGSVRELAKSGGSTLGARYDYDPYGRSSTVLGTTPTDINFTGLYRHSKSNLDLAVHRAYDPDLGRWLSRDPISEKGGLNLYGYVANDPLRLTDRLGHYGYETKYWADLSVNGNAAQRAIAWPLGILATILTPDSVGMTGSGTAGLLPGGTVGVDRQYFRGDSCPADFTFLGHSFDSDGASGPDHFVSPQLSAGFQVNFGWSGDYNPRASSWAGDFKETSSSAGPLGLTYFQGGSWRGFGIGVTAGPAPISASNLTVTYTPHP